MCTIEILETYKIGGYGLTVLIDVVFDEVIVVFTSVKIGDVYEIHPELSFRVIEFDDDFPVDQKHIIKIDMVKGDFKDINMNTNAKRV